MASRAVALSSPETVCGSSDGHEYMYAHMYARERSAFLHELQLHRLILHRLTPQGSSDKHLYIIL